MISAEFLDIVSQIVVVVSGVLAVLLVNRVDWLRKYGPAIGLAGQPAWFYTFVYHGQWLMLIVSIMYSYAWAQGVWNHWFRHNNSS